MKPAAQFSKGISTYLLAVLLAAVVNTATIASAADFTITTPGGNFFFQFNNTSNNPTLTLVRGNTYTFDLFTSPGFHPFKIATSVFGPAPEGISGANGQSTGTITFAVPTNAADCLYHCDVHGVSMSGSILMTDPPAPPTPPTIQIFGLKVSTNLTISSIVTSTNGYTLSPEFKTNVLGTNWFGLTVQSNQFLNGTNEIICGRPEGNAVFLRIRAQPN